jgi:hypothetical protein
MLLVFSLLTKTSPVSLAYPADNAAARNAPAMSGADNFLHMGVSRFLFPVASINLNP